MGLLLPGEPRRGGGGGRQVSQRSRRHPRSPRPTLLLVLLVLASAAAVSASAALHYRSDYGVGGGYRSGMVGGSRLALGKRNGPGVYRRRGEQHTAERRNKEQEKAFWEGERKEVDECMKIVADPGSYYFRSPGEPESAATCGMYVVAPANAVVLVEMEAVEVTCGEGLVVFFDGWEMNRHVFPDARDHHLPLRRRSTEMCGGERGKSFLSSQNAAMLQYRVPRRGEGFALNVRFINNPNPCNILMSEVEGIFTLSNPGGVGPRNCSLTTLLFPANFQMLGLKVGGAEEEDERPESCCAEGADFVELGGSSSLDSRDLQAKETFCGCDKDRAREKSTTVLCESSTVRLVSSGRHANAISVYARAADAGDLEAGGGGDLIICPDFMK